MIPSFVPRAAIQLPLTNSNLELFFLFFRVQWEIKRVLIFLFFADGASGLACVGDIGTRQITFDLLVDERCTILSKKLTSKRNIELVS